MTRSARAVGLVLGLSLVQPILGTGSNGAQSLSPQAFRQDGSEAATGKNAGHEFSGGSHAASDAQADKQTLRLRTDEVVVDASVTDKKEHPVTNLTADDFEIYEDGVKQAIISFRVEAAGGAVEKSGSPAAAAARVAPATPAMSGIGPGKLVAIVLDAETTRDAGLLARRAALAYVESGIGGNDFVAVFGIDQGLLVLAPFTQDKDVLKRAIEAFTSRESKRYNTVAGDIRREMEGLFADASDAERIAMADDPSAFSTRINPAYAAIMTAALRSLRTFDAYEKQFRALRLVDALLAIIDGQSSVQAARKSLLFFSEGLAVPAAASDQFVSVISAANRAGVTIYALDVAGLRAANPNAEAMLERDSLATRRMRNPAPELVVNGTSALGRMEDVARMDNVATLDELSEQTGGYTVKNTNDLVDGMKKIVEGLRNYYVMTYLPTNQSYDGKFRRIAVKLKNPAGLQLRARQGYFGLRTLDDSPVMMAELPLLERANAPSSQTDFPLYAEALHFRGTAGARQVAVYLQFPMSALKFDTDEKAKTFSSRFAMLVLVKNEAGVIVRKLGQEFSLHGPISQLDETAKTPEMYSRLILLEPGKYTLDGVARDSLSGKASVVHGTFEVPGVAAGAIGISSVVLSRGVNPLTEQQKKEPAHPLYLEGQAYFVPNVTQTFSAGSDKNLLVHFSVYPPKATGGKVSVSIGFYRNGSLVAESSGALPEPDATGRIPYSTSFGLEAFPPGEYQLRVTASDSGSRASSVARFEVRP